MKVYKAGDKYIAVHSKGNTVYSSQGGSEEEAKNKVLEMIKKIKNMAKFIKLTQRTNVSHDGTFDREISVNVEHIEFYYDRRIVFNHRAIDVAESYNKITELLKE